jgi:hypothetical protein
MEAWTEDTQTVDQMNGQTDEKAEGKKEMR